MKLFLSVFFFFLATTKQKYTDWSPIHKIIVLGSGGVKNHR